LRRCEELREARVRRREDGDREAVRTSEETPSLGVLIGKRFAFESLRRNGYGPKEAVHTTVVTGRSVAADPKSLIVFYRSHLGSCGNLFESILEGRDRERKDLVLQGDLSTSNLVTSDELLERFKIRFIGCSAHARRPFALYEDEDPVMCGAMLHLFLGLAIHEQQLDVFGRNPKNVLAVRGTDSRELWNDIRELANKMANRWSKATNLGAGARYIINHFEETAYLDDPRLEPSNTLRERMLRTEKLIEGSSMFRKSLEGRFVLDVVRTIPLTAVAAGAPAHEYLVSVLHGMVMEVGVELGAEPLGERDRPGLGLRRARLASLPPLEAEDLLQEHPARGGGSSPVAGERQPHWEGVGRHVLAIGRLEENVVHEVEGCVVHPPGAAGRAEPAAFAGEPNDQLVVAVAALHAGEALADHPARQVPPELLLDVPGELASLQSELAQEALQVLGDGLMEDGLLRPAALVSRQRAGGRSRRLLPQLWRCPALPHRPPPGG
jgi:hypothetical protein